MHTVRLRKQFENGRPILEIEDSGDAERVLRNRRHLGERARAFLVHGIVPPEDGWGGWLGRYQAAVKRTATEPTELQFERLSGHERYCSLSLFFSIPRPVDCLQALRRNSGRRFSRSTYQRPAPCVQVAS